MAKQSLTGKTAVIVGASSGIGKAIALTLAREGMNLALAARRDEALQLVASECESLGAQAIAVKTDVTDLDDVQNLVTKARSHFGDIDVWIHNAGVMAIGEFTQTPMDSHEQVIKTDLLGPIHGAYAILPYFKEKKKGLIITTVSLGAYVPNPFATAYSASKYGLRGFCESLRYELTEFPHIKICEVNPSLIDTPGILHIANYVGKEIKMPPPLYDPFQVAEAVKKLIHNPKPKIMIGNSGRLGRFAYSITPGFVGRFMAKTALTYFRGAPSKSLGHGNLFSPVYEGVTARGGNKEKRSFFSHFSLKKLSF